MTDNEMPKKGLFYWINEKYRLVLMNDETFQEERSYRLSPALAGMFVGVVLAISFLLFFLLMWLTPLGSIIPTSATRADQGVRADLIEMNRMLDELQDAITIKDDQIKKMQQVVYGEHETEEDVKNAKGDDSENTNEKGTPIPEKTDATEQLVESVENELELGSLVEDIFVENANVEQQIFFAPVSGIVSDTFAPNRNHYGTDIVAPKGSVIKATQKGTVIVATWSADTGHMLGIQHGDNIISFYKHNSSLLKKMGDLVDAGEAIAIIGNTGEMTDGPHLHFELWYKGQPVNPQRYVQF
ncbi:MAG: M23 family metallopeptidase [Aureispira sp.]|nr:M23 family metallopeptidase [Aureispira sp.]